MDDGRALSVPANERNLLKTPSDSRSLNNYGSTINSAQSPSVSISIRSHGSLNRPNEESIDVNGDGICEDIDNHRAINSEPGLIEEDKPRVIIRNDKPEKPIYVSSLFVCCPSISKHMEGVTCVSIFNMSIMCLVLVGYGLCFSLFSPFFPNEAGKKGMSPTTVGVLFGSYELVMFLGSPIAGKAVGHLGLRFMIGAGMLLAGGATMLFGVVDQSPNGIVYIVLCFAVRIVEASGASLYMTASYCIAGNLFPDNIAFVYSLMETANGVGSMIGPSAGGLLYTAGGFYLPFVTTGAILLLFGAISTVALPSSALGTEVIEFDDDGNRIDNKKKRKPMPWSRLYRHSLQAWIIGFTEAITAILSNYPEPTISIYFQSLGLNDPATVGAIFLASSVVYTIVCVVVGAIADKFPDHVYWMMAAGALLTGLTFFFMGPAPFVSGFIKPSIAITAAGEIILYAGIGLILVPIPRALLNAAKDAGFPEGMELSAMVAGLYNSLWFLGGFAGPPVAGFLLEHIGFQWGATVMSGLAFFLTAMLVLAATVNKIPVIAIRKQFNYGLLDEDDSDSEDNERVDDGNDTEDRAIDEGVDFYYDPTLPVLQATAANPQRSRSSTAGSMARPASAHAIYAVSLA